MEEFAAALNVSLASVNRWEVGKSVPNLTAMKAIKAFCEEHSQDYEMIEKEWITARLADWKFITDFLKDKGMITSFELI